MFHTKTLYVTSRSCCAEGNTVGLQCVGTGHGGRPQNFKLSHSFTARFPKVSYRQSKKIGTSRKRASVAESDSLLYLLVLPEFSNVRGMSKSLPLTRGSDTLTSFSIRAGTLLETNENSCEDGNLHTVLSLSEQLTCTLLRRV